MPARPARLTGLVLFLVSALSGAAVRAQPPPAQAGSVNELDAFMEKVLARREENRITLQQYILDEVERFELLGPGRTALYRQHREFTWYVRDGMHVRSPVKFEGVTVGEADRDEYEREWIRREQARRERRAKREREKGSVAVGIDGVQIDSGAAAVPAEPRFVSEAYFLEFKFDPGNYYLAGREQLEGIDVLRIEYYPERMFSEERQRERREERGLRSRDREREREFEDRVNRQMNKTALVTLWVDPSQHQIVKYTFENVWLDFLPGAWLVRVDGLHASMGMGQPFPGVWLPRELEVRAGVTLANGSFDASYARGFSEYRQADVKTRVRVPKEDDEPDDAAGGPALRAGEMGTPAAAETLPVRDVHHPAPAGARQEETIVEIRVHGNTFIPDADVIALAGVRVGQPVGAGTLQDAESRLKRSGRFESVEVRKRYRSLSDTTAVALLLIVHERPGVRSIEDDVGPVAGTWRRVRNRLMFLPIVTYADGYGFTYGARVSTVDLLGFGERLSMPATWGGTRRVAIEADRTFASGPLTRVESSLALWQRENPHFRLDDRRVEARARAERHFARVLRAGADVSRSTVDFAATEARLWTTGADLVLDTRGDPGFPRNAVLLGVGWQGLHVRGEPGRINRYVTDARGYLGLVRQAVVAGRVQYSTADRTLPPYERLLLGGSSTLRGFRTGAFAADRLLVTSAELRVPLTSVLSGARLGATVFVDASKALDVDDRFSDPPWHRGAGAGVFLIAPFVRLNLDVARGLKTGRTRAHLGLGFSF